MRLVFLGLFFLVLVYFGINNLRVTMGIGQFGSGNTDEAINCLNKSLSHNACPGDFEAHMWLGRCYERKKQYVNALAEYNKAIEIYHKIPIWIHLYSKNLSWSACSTLAYLYGNRAMINMRLHNYDEAVRDFTQAISYKQWQHKIDPIYCWSPYRQGYYCYWRSVCYYALRQNELAERDIEQLKKDGYRMESDEVPTSANWYRHVQAITKN